MEQRVDMLLDMSSESMFDYEGASADELITDDEIDKMIEEEVAHDEDAGVDKKISEGLKEVEKELDKG